MTQYRTDNIRLIPQKVEIGTRNSSKETLAVTGGEKGCATSFAGTQIAYEKINSLLQWGDVRVRVYILAL
eukprot:5033154-Amphidinium_carterae.1